MMPVERALQQKLNSGVTLGPDFGYFPNDKKCWIIAKPVKEESVREVFKETSINETIHGQKHLGVMKGSRELVSEKVSNWVNEVATLTEYALSQPQACYAAYTFGLKHLWTYFLRTLTDIQDRLEPLENEISQVSGSVIS